MVNFTNIWMTKASCACVFEVLLDNCIYRKSKHGQNSLLGKEIRNGGPGGVEGY